MADTPIIPAAPIGGTPAYSLWRTRIQRCTARRVLWEAYVASCAHYEAGIHNVSWDKRGKMRERFTEDNEVQPVINLFTPALANIVSRLISNDPHWNPIAAEGADVTDEEIDAADAILQAVWEGDENGDYSMKQELKLVIRNGWLQSGQLAYFRFDDERGLPCMDSFPLWDVYSDEAEKLRDKQWLAIAVKKDIEWIRHNADFDQEVRDAVVADNKIAQSHIQQQFLRRQMGGGPEIGDTAMLFYTFEVKVKGDPKNNEEYMEEEDQFLNAGLNETTHVPTPEIVDDTSEENDDEIIGDGDTSPYAKKESNRYILCTVEATNGTLQKFELNYPRLSVIFDIFKPKEDGRFYGIPLCNDWIDPNKSIDKTNANIENYLWNFLQGRYIIRNRSVVVPVAGRQGQKIIDETGSSIQQLELHPLPSTHFSHLNNQNMFFDRISGVHDVNTGGAKPAQAGVAIAQNAANDEANSSDPVDNYKQFLKRAGKKLLRQAADHWKDVKTIYHYDQTTQQRKPMKLVSHQFFDQEAGEHEGAVKIYPFSRLNVDIEIGAFWKKSQQREQIVSLLQAGWNPGGNPIVDMVVLSSYEIGVGREIVRQLKNVQNPWSFIAQGNIQLVKAGQPPLPIVENAPHQFLQQQYANAAEEELKAGNQAGAQALNALAQKEAILAQAPGGNAGNPNLPNGPTDFSTGVLPPGPPQQIPGAAPQL